jgi:AcrR family transcriptional regulator
MVAKRSIRPSREQIDSNILDVTAGLIARRGIKDTAVQAVADAAGYSKTGILNRFPSKDVLVDAAVRQCVQLTRAAHAQVEGTTDQAARDAGSLAALTDLALERRGWIELVLASLPPFRDDDLVTRLVEMGEIVSDMFGVGRAADAPLERRARVVGALGALTVLALTYENDATPERARPLILATCWGALGHGGTFPE